jgi:hypothetical protein
LFFQYCPSKASPPPPPKKNTPTTTGASFLPLPATSGRAFESLVKFGELLLFRGIRNAEQGVGSSVFVSSQSTNAVVFSPELPAPSALTNGHAEQPQHAPAHLSNHVAVWSLLPPPPQKKEKRKKEKSRSAHQAHAPDPVCAWHC